MAAEGTKAAWWHSTVHGAGPLRPCMHFGTRQAALDRLVVSVLKEARWGLRPASAVAYVTDAAPRRVLRIDDAGTDHGPGRLARAVAAAGAMPSSWAEGVRAAAGEGQGARGTPEGRDLAFAGIADALEARGYDAMAYENRSEDPGSESIVLLHPARTAAVATRDLSREAAAVARLLDGIRMPSLAEVEADFGEDFTEANIEAFMAHEPAAARAGMAEKVRRDWLPWVHADCSAKLRVLMVEPRWPPALEPGIDPGAALRAMIAAAPLCGFDECGRPELLERLREATAAAADAPAPGPR